VAGRAAPNATIALLSDGAKFAEGKADGGGAFVIIPPALPAGDHILALRASGPEGAVTSAQTVAVDVPSRAGGQTLVALAAPDEPTRVLNSAPNPASAGLSIASVEAGENGAFFASGTAPPGSAVRLFANGSLLAGATAGPDGAWSMKADRKLVPGHYDMRAEATSVSDGSVMASAAAPFDYGPAGEVRSITVERGDNLWRISRRILGQGIRYTQIYQANAGQIRDPDKIWPGQVFVAPKGESK